MPPATTHPTRLPPKVDQRPLLRPRTAPTLGLVVPCFNEAEVLGETTVRLLEVLKTMQDQGVVSPASAIIYVDDGSHDDTWGVIDWLSRTHAAVSGIKLSRNCGHQNALLCGLLTAPGDCLISLDADLQDDLDVIPRMVAHYQEGCDIVYGVRSQRRSDTWFKRQSAEAYYKLLASLNIDVVFNHADYRLLSRAAIRALSGYREVNLFLRGIVRLLGYRSAIVEYERAERFAGESKYPLRKMLSFAWQGITAFSTAPLRLITTIGFAVSIFSAGLAIWGLFMHAVMKTSIPGWTSTVVPIYFLGGLQMLSLGVIGEYMAKIYTETKDRPRYHIEMTIGSSLEPARHLPRYTSHPAVAPKSETLETSNTSHAESAPVHRPTTEPVSLS